jgi:hypothetical protein
MDPGMVSRSLTVSAMVQFDPDKDREHAVYFDPVNR